MIRSGVRIEIGVADVEGMAESSPGWRLPQGQVTVVEYSTEGRTQWDPLNR